MQGMSHHLIMPTKPEFQNRGRSSVLDLKHPKFIIGARRPEPAFVDAFKQAAGHGCIDLQGRTQRVKIVLDL